LTRDQQARKTCFVVGAVLAALCAWSAFRHHPLRAGIFAVAAALLALIGLAIPSWARAFHTGWMKFAETLGWINSRIILGVLYFGILSPLGWLLRLTGRDPLVRRGPSRESYWVPRMKPRQDREQFERLF